MANSSFGIDPDKGQDKTLRIYARGPNGQERMFEYRGRHTVDGHSSAVGVTASGATAAGVAAGKVAAVNHNLR